MPESPSPVPAPEAGTAAEGLDGGGRTAAAVLRAVRSPRSPVLLLRRKEAATRTAVLPHVEVLPGPDWIVDGTMPGTYPEWLGDQDFCARHGLRFPYVVGEMANGIATTTMVAAAAESGLLGVFGAGGLAPGQVEEALERLNREIGEKRPWGVNLIHSPVEPAAEQAVAALLIRHRVPVVSLSAFMELTPAVLRVALGGIRQAADGTVLRPRRIIAKVSRPETARVFMSPAPADQVRALVAAGTLTAEEGKLAARIPVAGDITAESDSGGHTDNRPLTALLPRLLALRDEVARQHGSAVSVGAAGGLGTPEAVAAAFAAGAAYVVTGSINQTTVEAGVSRRARELLAAADFHDVVMAPAADMFELGVRVQVLSKGTMFAHRARRLHELYRQHASLTDIPAADLRRLERDVFHASVADIWTETERFWTRRDPRELERAAQDPRHRMALLFRWYLGQASRWAIQGEPDRALDYQLWCGPALGAFNHWITGSFLADPQRRTVAQVALNLLEGATVVTRAHQLRSLGVPVPAEAFSYRPRPLA
ncbi:PfaD family polyunsaturated fatty acid/polyketide biosynthesis protein [Streptomyces sp. NPDC002776]